MLVVDELLVFNDCMLSLYNCCCVIVFVNVGGFLLFLVENKYCLFYFVFFIYLVLFVCYFSSLF